MIMSILVVAGGNCEESSQVEYIDIPILMYHHIDDTKGSSTIVSEKNFRNQMKALKDAGYNTIHFDDLVEYTYNSKELPNNPICITFDDGYLSNYEIAYPILDELNMRATIFVIGSSVGKTKYKDTDHDITPHFSWEQANEMIQSGVMDIQSHTWDMHQWAPFESGKYVRESITKFDVENETRFRQVIEGDCSKIESKFIENLGYKPNILAYPRGQYTDVSTAELIENGYIVTLTTKPGTNRVIKGNPYSLINLNRFNIDNSTSTKELLDLIK